MKKLFLFCIAISSIAAQAQKSSTAQTPCTDESVLNEPGRFLDAHIGSATGGGISGYSAAEIAYAKKMMAAFENVCKPKLQFTGGQAKASFGLNSRGSYNQLYVSSYMYNLGFHKFVCNVQTHKLVIVDEYQGVLRVKGNPFFQPAFRTTNDNVYDASMAVYKYSAFSDNRVIDAINKGTGFIDLPEEGIGANRNLVLEYRPVDGYGYIGSSNNFVKMGTSFIFHHAFITHTDIPFFIPVSRKKFLTDLLQFYDHEGPVLASNMQVKIKNLAGTITESEKTNSSYLQDQKNRMVLLQQSAREILSVNKQKKQTVTNLLQTKDEQWLNAPAVIQFDDKSFIVPYDRNRNLKEVYGDFYITEFYTGAEGLQLFQVNPDYLKKYPPNGVKPSLINVVYRFTKPDKFLMGVKESFIDHLDLEEFRKLIE